MSSTYNRYKLLAMHSSSMTQAAVKTASAAAIRTAVIRLRVSSTPIEVKACKSAVVYTGAQSYSLASSSLQSPFADIVEALQKSKYHLHKQAYVKVTVSRHKVGITMPHDTQNDVVVVKRGGRHRRTGRGRQSTEVLPAHTPPNSRIWGARVKDSVHRVLNQNHYHSRALLVSSGSCLRLYCR